MLKPVLPIQAEESLKRPFPPDHMAIPLQQLGTQYPAARDFISRRLVSNYRPISLSFPSQ